MRDQYAEFQRRGADVVCVAPHDVSQSKRLMEELGLPFPVLADENRAVFLEYDVQSRLWSLGQRPAIYVIDKTGVIRWAHLGTQQWDIPSNQEVFAVLDGMAVENSEA